MGKSIYNGAISYETSAKVTALLRVILTLNEAKGKNPPNYQILRFAQNDTLHCCNFFRGLSVSSCVAAGHVVPEADPPRADLRQIRLWRTLVRLRRMKQCNLKVAATLLFLRLRWIETPSTIYFGQG